MKKSSSLSDLLMEELGDLLIIENQLVEVLPKMALASQSSALKIALMDHLEVTREHAYRLQDIFRNIGQNPQGVICNIMQGFITEIEDVVNKMEKCPARDAVIISIDQRVEQYEIVRYQKACEHADDLGHTRIVELLNTTLEEERTMNLHLNELAQYAINAQTVNPFEQSIQPQEPPSKPRNGGFYIPEAKLKRGGIKKKPKNIDVSRFISEGNPNVQEPQKRGEEKEDQRREE